jgi:hypothetical protein
MAAKGLSVNSHVEQRSMEVNAGRMWCFRNLDAIIGMEIFKFGNFTKGWTYERKDWLILEN